MKNAQGLTNAVVIYDGTWMPKFSKCCCHCCINLCSRCINSFRDAISATQFFLTSFSLCNVFAGITCHFVTNCLPYLRHLSAYCCKGSKCMWNSLAFVCSDPCLCLSHFWQSKEASTLVQNLLSPSCHYRVSCPHAVASGQPQWCLVSTLKGYI